MTIKGDMEAFCKSRLGIPMAEAHKVIACALEAADDPNFALRFQSEVETASGFTDYLDVIKFLRSLM